MSKKAAQLEGVNNDSLWMSVFIVKSYFAGCCWCTDEPGKSGNVVPESDEVFDVS